MTTGGWIIMMVSVAAVTLFFGWCLFRVLTAPPIETKENLSVRKEAK